MPSSISNKGSNTLHIINKSPSDQRLYRRCFDSLLAGDAILFIESAVFVCIDKENLATTTDISYYLLEADVEARGLHQQKKLPFQIINDDGFVDLCCQYKKTISWF